MSIPPDDPSVVTGATAPERRQLAREMADELLGRGAGIARAAIKPLGFIGRLAVIAGVVIWMAGPAPFWENAPHMLSSAIALGIFAYPGMRLLRHRARMQDVLENLPNLLDNVTNAMSMTDDLGDLGRRWRQSGGSARGGLLGTGKRCFDFYRNDLAPLRHENRVLEQVNDALSAFSGPALVLTGVCTVLALVVLALSPIAVVVRLIVLSG